MTALNRLVVNIFCLFALRTAGGLPYESEYGPEYGEDWMYFLDDNGTTHTMNFSTFPADSRGMALGNAYFYLYTRLNNDSELLTISENNSLVASEYFNASNDIKVITHGWLSSKDVHWLQYVKDAILRVDDANVIAVDWSELADNPVYPWSACSTRYVGKQIAKLLSGLTKTYNIEDGNIHLIGHSLGAQVMGYAGTFLNSTVNRITGLDPARPLFEFPQVGSGFRLEKSDAHFVDIIHTGGGIFGYKRSHGHADFYPNDGRPKQPGCEGVQKIIEACSHGRSTEYFGESIDTDTAFVAYPCESWNKFEKCECKENPTVMGYLASTERLGDYYLYTNDHPQYAKGEV